jgi:hypothetical protein
VAVTHAGLRASDDDRNRVVADLQRHATAGRLTLNEFSERAKRAYAAATHGELAGITHDLPPVPPPAPAEPPNTEQRQLIVAFLLAAITLFVIGLAIAIWR